MDTQSRPERAAQTILIVEEDEALRGILDHSLRHAGFAVGLASTADEAFRRLDDGPDLVIAGRPAAWKFAGARSSSTDHLPPAVVLIAEPGVENKTRGLEAGADDFVVKPIYVQEVVARAKALLQRRERERLELSASAASAETASERFVSDIADVPLVDLVRAVAAHQKSGVASDHGADGRARRNLLPAGERRRRRGGAAVRARRRLSSVLLGGRSPGSRVEEHPAQGHRRDATAGVVDRGAGARRRVAAAARPACPPSTRCSRSTTACWPSGWPTSPTK